MERRNFIAGAAIAPLAALPAVAQSERLYTEQEVMDLCIASERYTARNLKGTDLIDPLVKLRERYLANYEWYNVYDRQWVAGELSNQEFEKAIDPVYAERNKLLDQIFGMVAISLEGLKAQYDVFYREIAELELDGYCDEWKCVGKNMAMGLEALA